MTEPASARNVGDLLTSIRRLLTDEPHSQVMEDGLTVQDRLQIPPTGFGQNIAQTSVDGGMDSAAVPPLPGSKSSLGKLLLTPALRVVSKEEGPPTRPAGAETAASATEEREGAAIAEVAKPLSLGAFTSLESSADFSPFSPFASAAARGRCDSIEGHPPVYFGEAAPLGVSPPLEVYDEDGLDHGGSGLQAVLETFAEKTAARQDGLPAASHEGGDAFRDRVVDAIGEALPEIDLWEGEWGGAADTHDSADPTPSSMTGTSGSAAFGPVPNAQDAPEAVHSGQVAGARVAEHLPRSYGSLPSVEYSVDTSDLVLDEEQLRDLVRDIIRDELAGQLGERITRNVRKLVRLEINRMLLTRDLD